MTGVVTPNTLTINTEECVQKRRLNYIKMNEQISLTRSINNNSVFVTTTENPYVIFPSKIQPKAKQFQPHNTHITLYIRINK